MPNKKESVFTSCETDSFIIFLTSLTENDFQTVDAQPTSVSGETNNSSLYDFGVQVLKNSFTFSRLYPFPSSRTSLCCTWIILPF